MGRTDSTGWNKKVVPKATTASHSNDIVGNGSGETVQHNDILSEIQQLRKQINDIKEKKNMKSTPLPFAVNKAAIAFKGGISTGQKGEIKGQMKGIQIIPKRNSLITQQGKIPKSTSDENSVKVDQKGNVVNTLQEASIIVNNTGKGKNLIDTQSFNKSIELDEFGNIIKSSKPQIPAKPVNIGSIIIKESKLEEKPEVVKTKPEESAGNKVAGIGQRPKLHKQEQVSSSSQAEQMYQQYSQMYMNTPPPPQSYDQLYLQQQQQQQRQQFQHQIPQPIQQQQQMQQLSYQQQQYQLQQQRIQEQAYKQMMELNAQYGQYIQQQQQQQQQQQMQYQQQQYYNNSIPNYSLPPSIYNQPNSQSFGQPLPKQKIPMTGNPVKSPLEEANQKLRNLEVNSDGHSTTSDSSGSFEQNNQNNSSKTPFGPKLSLKKPKQREPAKRQLSEREKLLEEISTIGPYQPGFARQVSTTSDDSVFSKTSQGAPQVQTNPSIAVPPPPPAAVATISNGYPQSVPPPPPPVQSNVPFLKPIGSRKIKQKEIIREKSISEQLMEQIRSSTSVSDNYVFDGNNQEKVSFAQNGIVKSDVGRKKVINSEPDGRGMLLSEIQNGFKLKPVPE